MWPLLEVNLDFLPNKPSVNRTEMGGHIKRRPLYVQNLQSGAIRLGLHYIEPEERNKTYHLLIINDFADSLESTHDHCYCPNFRF